MSSSAHSYVEGANLVGLIWDVRSEFLRRAPYELDDSRQPNSVRLVAVEVLAAKCEIDRRLILHDTDCVDVWLGNAEPGQVFAYSATPRDCVTDLICEVVSQVLRRDDTIKAEDDRRQRLAEEAASHLERVWWTDPA